MSSITDRRPLFWLKAVLAHYESTQESRDMNRKSKGGGRKGTDNVLVDLGFEDAAELSARVTLALKLNKLIDQRGLSQAEASQLLGIAAAKNLGDSQL